MQSHALAHTKAQNIEQGSEGQAENGDNRPIHFRTQTALGWTRGTHGSLEAASEIPHFMGASLIQSPTSGGTPSIYLRTLSEQDSRTSRNPHSVQNMERARTRSRELAQTHSKQNHLTHATGQSFGHHTLPSLTSFFISDSHSRCLCWQLSGE